ncbi:VWA domain-containing protein [bacterium]|nr:VWA domain-containing protein [bacterium]
MKRLISTVVLMCGLLFGQSLVLADGVIIIEPPGPPHILPRRPAPIPEALPIKYHRVKVDIDNQVATTSIDQVFKNPYDVDLEGTYIFPLPEEAAISGFAMYMDGKRVSGEVLDKDKARQIYEDIVRRMKDPGLLEYVGRNMFKARVYPIPGHGEKRIELVYQQTLKYDDGLYSYTYPLDTERFSPVVLEEVTISAKVKSKVPIKSLYSPSHEIQTKIEQHEASCGYEERNVKPDKDFILYYTVSEKDVGLNLLCHRGPGEDGYFLMMLSPGELKREAIDKDIIFVLDTSGSMSGSKIEQAKEALRFCINSLGRGDRFNLINFATEVSPYRDGLVKASDENIKGALDFIDRLKARGGTNINEALLAVLKMFADPKRPGMVVFLTDGEPTVGVTQMKDIVGNLADANRARARIFVFGVGDDVNTHLLDKVSDDHRGLSLYVEPEENIEVKVSSFMRKISEPILTDIRLDPGKIRIRDIYPLDLPDIFSGEQLLLLGRYEGSGATAITLKGYADGKEKRFVYEDRFPKESKENDFIPRIWAMRKIGYLMSEIRLKGENKELVDEIVALSKEHGIMTPYTSFLVLEEEADHERWGITAQAAPEMKEKGRRFNMAMESAVGRAAISSAKDIIVLKEEKVAKKPALSTIKHVGAKTFYLQDGVWVDSKYKEGREVKEVKYLSQEYLDLLRRKPEIGRYFALSKNIIVLFEGEYYRVTE